LAAELLRAFLVMLMGCPLFVLRDFRTNIAKAANAKPHIPDEHCSSKSSLSLQVQLGRLGLLLNLALSVEGRALKQGSWLFASLRQQSQAFLKNPFVILQIKALLICAGITFVLGAAASHW